MEECSKTVKISRRNIGIIGTKKCTKPVYKDGLCKYHYDKQQNKLINWIDRDGYKPATIEDLNRGRSMKLQNSHVHKLYRARKGIIQSCKQDVWIDTNMEYNPNLFCVRDYNAKI